MIERVSEPVVIHQRGAIPQQFIIGDDEAELELSLGPIWRIKDDLQKYFLYCRHWSDSKWKKSMAGGV